MILSSERRLVLERMQKRRAASRRTRPHGSRRYTLASDRSYDSPAQSSLAETLQVQVLYRVEATESAVTLWLARPGTHEAPAPYLPGQFTTLALSVDGVRHQRSYSLCSDGSPDWPWEITVKREGLVSGILCDTIVPGALLQASAPHGAFTLPEPLDPEAPLIFVAAGSGITPIYGMLRAIASLPLNQRPPVQLHYAVRNQSEMIFAGELARLDPDEYWLRQWHYVSAHSLRLTPGHLLEIVEQSGTDASAADWYICTPERLKQSLTRALHARRVSPTRVHMEVFASPKGRVRTPSRRINGSQRHDEPRARLRLAESGSTLDVQPGETLLETLEWHGYQHPFSCRAGACGECKLRVLAGHVTPDGTGMLTPAERSAGYVLSCIAQPQGEVTLAGVASLTGELASATHGPRKTSKPSSRRGIKMLMRAGMLAATIGLFGGAWLLTSPSALTTPHATSDVPPHIHSSSPAVPPTPTPDASGNGK